MSLSICHPLHKIKGYGYLGGVLMSMKCNCKCTCTCTCNPLRKKKKRTHIKKTKKPFITKSQLFGKYKYKILPLITDKGGRLITTTKTIFFCEKKTIVDTQAEFMALPFQDISLSTQYVYSVHNLGYSDAEVEIEIGPSQDSLTNDIGIEIIPAQQSKIVTPLRFSKYIRLLYRSADAVNSTRLSIVFQAQNHY